MATLSKPPCNTYHYNSNPGIFHTLLSNTRISQLIKSKSKSKSKSRLQSPRNQVLCVSAILLETVDHTVTVHSTSMVTPITATKRKSLFLSNLDHTYKFKTRTVLFFSMNPSFSFDKIVDVIKDAYRKILVQYDFMAGRLKCNNGNGRLEIDCNAAGAGFRVASCEMSLEELRAIGFPNTANEQFAPRKLTVLVPDDQPVFIIQMTSLRCGGFALGISINHVTMDGISLKIFLENIASVIAENNLVVPPYNNRELLSARSPPCVTLPHPEIFNFESINRDNSNAVPLKATFQKLDSKYFQLSHNDIMYLKQKARLGCSVSEASAFNVVAAHIWKCVAQAKNPEIDPEKLSTILYAVNIRSRVRPRLPSSYAGNAIVCAYGTTTCGEIRKGPLSHLVQLISQGDKRVNDEYVKSYIDWLELHKGFPYGDTFISSWWNLGIHEIEYPWGRPRWSCPVMPNHGNNAITLIPEVEGERFKGLQILVSLQRKQLETFEGLFQEL